MFFVLKLEFPGKNNGKNQRRQVFGGAERTKSFA
jgi:hypothetical protein